ncbi:hypothetical protein l11_16380 [Neisseria weaveri LMG 5135]|nr:hypothetical protein l11_16380 [Neisseria weaveri LMG 5135]
MTVHLGKNGIKIFAICFGVDNIILSTFKTTVFRRPLTV